MILGQAQRIAELNDLRFASEIEGVPVIAFTSGKGGTGKTTLALNIANLLAKAGKRTLVADFDLNFANLHAMLNIFPEYTLADFFEEKLPLEKVVFEYKKNLFFLFGESASGAAAKLTKAQLNEFFYRVKSSGKFDVVILDTSSGGAPETLDIIGFADFAVVVATPEPTAVMDAYAIIKLMLVHGNKTKNYVLVNKSPNKNEAEIAFRNVQTAAEHFLKAEIFPLGYIPESSAIKKSAYAQTLFTEENRSGKLADAIGKVVDTFLADLCKNGKRKTLNRT